VGVCVCERERDRGVLISLHLKNLFVFLFKKKLFFLV
jgi:hypothetical protein